MRRTGAAGAGKKSVRGTHFYIALFFFEREDFRKKLSAGESSVIGQYDLCTCFELIFGYLG